MPIPSFPVNPFTQFRRGLVCRAKCAYSKPNGVGLTKGEVFTIRGRGQDGFGLYVMAERIGGQTLHIRNDFEIFDIIDTSGAKPEYRIKGNHTPYQRLGFALAAAWQDDRFAPEMCYSPDADTDIVHTRDWWDMTEALRHVRIGGWPDRLTGHQVAFFLPDGTITEPPAYVGHVSLSHSGIDAAQQGISKLDPVSEHLLIKTEDETLALLWKIAFGPSLL